MAGSDFVARTVAGVAGALEQAVFSENLARLPGLLQGTDPRAKVAATLVLLLAVGLARHIPTLAVAYLLVLLLAWLSRLSPGGFSRRVWLGIPFFAGLIALPSLFLLPGRPVVSLLDEPPLRLAITDNGLASASLLVARVGTSVSLALLLVSTTRWTELLQGLRVLRVPEGFLVVLGMTYRYVFLLLRSASNLFLARASRTVGSTSGGEQRRWAAGATGVLVSRSVKLSGEVLLAMRARGFDGEVRTATQPRMRDEDWLLVTMGMVAAAALLLLDRSIPFSLLSSLSSLVAPGGIVDG